MLIAVQDGMTALHYAVWNALPNRVLLISKLIDMGVDIDAIDFERRTPLHYAVSGEQIEVIPLLIEAGASLTLKEGAKHKTAVELAPTE
jgi:ankyrin repeat protein